MERAIPRLAALALCACACAGGAAKPDAAPAAGKPAVDPRDLELLGRMTLQEKVDQLSMLAAGVPTGPDADVNRRPKTLEDHVRAGLG